MVDVIAVSKYFVHLSFGNKSRSLTPLKLQKLLYLAQGWSYVWDNSPLFKNDFEAWQYGPVCVEVYDYFKKYHSEEIPEIEGVVSLGDKNAEETVEAIWDDFSDYTAYDLVEMTHKQEPWRRAYKEHTIISKKDIQHYFQSTF